MSLVTLNMKVVFFSMEEIKMKLNLEVVFLGVEIIIVRLGLVLERGDVGRYHDVRGHCGANGKGAGRLGTVNHDD